jgi:hypothetical protein
VSRVLLFYESSKCVKASIIQNLWVASNQLRFTVSSMNIPLQVSEYVIIVHVHLVRLQREPSYGMLPKIGVKLTDGDSAGYSELLASRR